MSIPNSTRTESLIKLSAVSRSKAILIWSIVLLSFLPYAALPAGDNTNIPIVSIVSLLTIPYAMRRLPIVAAGAILLSLPLIALFVSMLCRNNITSSNIITSFVWMTHLLPFFAWSVSVIWSIKIVANALKFALFVSSLYAIVQKLVFLDNGTIPLLYIYNLPGYWSVGENSEVIVNYIRRPFGWFPEPSFMAGSLSIGLAIFLLLKSHIHRGIHVTDWAVLVIVLYCLVLSDSGSSAITILFIVVILYWPRRLTKVGRIALIPAGIGAVFIALSLFIGRSATTINYSWNDRFASIASGLEYLVSNPRFLLAGVGKGNATVLASAGEFDYSSFGAFHGTEDIVSVTGRMVVECGLLGVLAVLFVLVLIYLGSYRLLGVMGGLSLTGLWLVVGFLTISYESATLIWALPGVCGALLNISTKLTDVGDLEMNKKYLFPDDGKGLHGSEYRA